LGCQCLPFHHTPYFTPDALPATTLSVYAGLGQALSCAALHNRGLLASYILLPKLEMTFLFHQWPQLSPHIAPLLQITENLSLDQLLAVDVHLIYIHYVVNLENPDTIHQSYKCE